jgi:23S rRNA (guanosine2251-2'-O)-methyltransferase
MRDRDRRGGKGRDQGQDRPGSGGGKPFKPRFKPRFGDRDRSKDDFRPEGGFKRKDGFKQGGFKRRKKQFRDPANKPPLDRTILYGWHPVVTALANPKRRLRRLVLTENASRRLTEEGITPKQSPELVRPEVIDRMLTEDAVHQGLYAEFDPLPEPELTDIEPGLILVLDQITDPHNFGAIVRSAAAFGVKAIVTTARHSPDATGVLAKSASGGLEHVPLVLVQNLARAMNELKSSGWQLVGLAEEGETDISEARLRKPLALVLGAEGKGLRQLTRETCDFLTRVDLPGEIKSLNVSNAAALALYAATQSLKTGSR